ncbi:MAG: septum formation initiator family protein [Candidatus Hydrogenedentota bacterium]
MRIRTGMWYWLALAFILGAVVFYAQQHDVFGLYDQYQESERAVQELDERLSAATAEEAVSREHVEHLERDPLEIEAAIRDGKGLVRDGETIYRVELPLESANE